MKHAILGPIVRISPFEIHINDPEYIDTVYPGPSHRSMKYAWAMRQFGLRTSFLSTISHELHRIRRGALSNFFSKASLQRLEPGVQAQIDKLVSRLRHLQGSGRNVNLLDVYACLTGDIIGQYAFGKPHGFLDGPDDFSRSWHKPIMDVLHVAHLLKQFGWLLPLMQLMPIRLVKIMQPHVATLIEFQAVSSPIPRPMTGKILC